MFHTVYILTKEHYTELAGPGIGIQEYDNCIVVLNVASYSADTFVEKEFFRSDVNFEDIKGDYRAIKDLFCDRTRLVEGFDNICGGILGGYESELHML